MQIEQFGFELVATVWATVTCERWAVNAECQSDARERCKQKVLDILYLHENY